MTIEAKGSIVSEKCSECNVVMYYIDPRIAQEGILYAVEGYSHQEEFRLHREDSLCNSSAILDAFAEIFQICIEGTIYAVEGYILSKRSSDYTERDLYAVEGVMAFYAERHADDHQNYFRKHGRGQSVALGHSMNVLVLNEIKVRIRFNY